MTRIDKDMTQTSIERHIKELGWTRAGALWASPSGATASYEELAEIIMTIYRRETAE